MGAADQFRPGLRRDYTRARSQEKRIFGASNLDDSDGDGENGSDLMYFISRADRLWSQGICEFGRKIKVKNNEKGLVPVTEDEDGFLEVAMTVGREL